MDGVSLRSHSSGLRALVAHICCQKMWLRCQTRALVALKSSSSYGKAREDFKVLSKRRVLSHVASFSIVQMNGIRKIIKGGSKRIHECQDEIDKTLEAAEKTRSATRVVDACKGALQIHLESIRFTIEISGHEVARAMNKNTFQLEDTGKQQQTATIRKAEKLIEIALNVCTSVEQVGPIVISPLRG